MEEWTKGLVEKRCQAQGSPEKQKCPFFLKWLTGLWCNIRGPQPREIYTHMALGWFSKTLHSPPLAEDLSSNFLIDSLALQSMTPLDTKDPACVWMQESGGWTECMTPASAAAWGAPQRPSESQINTAKWLYLQTVRTACGKLFSIGLGRPYKSSTKDYGAWGSRSQVQPPVLPEVSSALVFLSQK